MKRINPFSAIYQELNNGSTTPISDMPLIIDIEITNACNFNCLFCHTGTKAHKRPIGFMSKDLYKQIINEISPHKIPLRFIRWGEPMLHKHFFEFLEIAKTNQLICHLNTNGSFLNRETISSLLHLEIDSLKYSFQGTDEKTYREMRYGQDFNKLVNAVQLFWNMRGDLMYPYLHAATTITYETPQMVQEFKARLEPYCDLVTVGQTKLSHISPDQINLPQEAKDLLRQAKTNESIDKTYKKCNEVYNKLSINWDGTVSACCGDYDNYMIVGDIKKTSIYDIWNKSQELKNYRSLLNEYKHEELPLCKNCYDTMNLRAPIR